MKLVRGSDILALGESMAALRRLADSIDPERMNRAVKTVALAMRARASQPLGNIKSLDPVLVGSLGDAWECLAAAAITAYLSHHETPTRTEGST